MRNIRLRLQYEGTRYQGWQKQTSTDNTIQGKMEVLLTKMCGEPVEIAASGRTDAGVHALGQVANFHTESDMSTEEIMAYCNRYLPEDIAVVEVSEAAPRFHSRLNATGKRYRYRIINSQIPDVFWRRYALEEPENLNLDAMREAAELLLGEHDFKAFTSAKKSKKSTIRRIDEIRIEQIEDRIEFVFTGNGFLHHGNPPRGRKGNPDTGECDGCTGVRRQSEGGSAGTGQRPGTGRSFLHLKNKNTATFCPTITSSIL